MAEVVYECAVNKSHPQKKLATPQTLAPQCCNKPMVQVQTPTTVTSTAQTAAKPQSTAQPAGTPKYMPSGGKPTQKR